ncbi:hypothetical protein A4X13_0g677 [Tilletia indica]|uniref:Enoyl-CoA hydratase n=1 Tax=Tilletia indica TaxID=43049 RepID=A0A177TU55_9BASI|nr:hypothetical protein A4X13_0g677 [Tilletia indica]
MTSSFPQSYKKLATEFHLVQFESEGVLRVSFNRPPVNAWHDPMWRELHVLFDTISTDGDVAVVVLSGEGRAFTAGLDLKSNELFTLLATIEDVGRRAFAVHAHIKHFQAAISSIEKCGKPVIAAVHGIAYGLALDLMSACDIRYVASCARMSIREVDIGLAADIGTLQRFPKTVGNDSLARELAYSARVFDAREALSIGFVSKITEQGQPAVVAAALGLAKEIASKSPVAVQSTKAILLHARDNTVDAGLAFTAAWNAAMLQTEDIPIATQAVMAKQKPTFSKL